MKNVKKGIAGIAAAWCSLMHRGATWPIHGHYQCTKCYRMIAAPWA
jgi:hypothetical protein